jgi:Calx-beta domain
MKRKTLATLLVLVFLAVLVIWSLESSAANNAGRLVASGPETEANQIFANEDQEEQGADVDADLGKHAGRIDREEYLRARDEYIARKRGIEPGRPFNPELRSEAIDQMERQEKGRRLESLVNGSGLTPASGGAWTALGPAPLPNGVGSNPSTGRVTSIAVDPTNSSKVYLGTAQGGVWRSLNGGSTWEAIFDNADSLAIGALAVAPSNPTILYVGTGEFNSCGDCFFGAGLYRIDNVDTTPSLLGPINPQQTIGNLTYKIFNGRSITRILVHPSDAATIFVSTARGVGGSGANALGSIPTLAPRGVFRSTNATSASPTFQKLVVNNDASVDSPGTGNADICDMAMEPGNPDNILVAAIGLTIGSGIYRSTNATSPSPTFSNQLTVTNSAGSPVIGARINLAINKAGSTVTVYAATSEPPTVTTGCTSSSNTGAIRKSIDGGASWSGQLTGGGGFCSGQCFYDMPIAVDPNNANLVYIGGQVASTCGGVVRKATDGGNIVPAPSPSPTPIPNSFVQDSTGLHADNHALVFDGAGNIYCGNDGGIWKRSATAAAGTAWTNLNVAPLNTLQFESIAVHPIDRFLTIGGTQDNGTEFQQTSAGNWSNAEGGDGGYCLIDQSATDTTNTIYYHTFFNQTGNQIGFDRINLTQCLPCKNSWESRGSGALASGPVPLCDGTLSNTSCDGTTSAMDNGLQLSDAVLFYAPMALGPGAPNTVYFGTDRLYRSNDLGDHMTVVSQASITSPGVNGSPISTIAIWPGGDNVRMIGTQNGQVWGTANGSSTLVNLNPPLPANPAGGTNKFIGRAMIDPNNKDVAYVTLSYYAPAGQGIWKITNLSSAAVGGGATPNWVAAGSGIPSVPINAFAIDPQNPNNLYAGTDIGVYFSNDAGASWAPFGTGLPRSAVFDLKIQPSNRILRAATHGRGIWETALVSPAASTLQFNSGTTSVTEGTGGTSVDATVTITRSGDTSFPASVNYATGDSSGANGCSVNTGAASSRCDYIATSGTLNFAANEISKTITIPITYDSYIESPETFTVTLSAPGGLSAGLGSPSTITITINDSGFSGPNQIDNDSFFVREHYVDFLNREPDSGGIGFWTDQMTHCGPGGSSPSDLTVCHVNVSGAFFLSIEFQQTGYLVERMYKVAFGDATGTSNTGGAHTLRVPVIRLNQFLPDTQRIGRGVIVGQGNWQQQLEDNKNAFSEEFVQRPAFLQALPLSMTPAAFVDALNGNAKDNNDVRPLSTTERDNLVNALTTGTMTRAQVVRAIAEDSDLAISERNRAFVLEQYFGYLRRNPNDPQDSDYSGYEFWLGKLNQFNGDYVGAEMVKAFISADEYRHRFAAN